jgi:hypothetical protein
MRRAASPASRPDPFGSYPVVKESQDEVIANLIATMIAAAGVVADEEHVVAYDAATLRAAFSS